MPRLPASVPWGPISHNSLGVVRRELEWLTSWNRMQRCVSKCYVYDMISRCNVTCDARRGVLKKDCCQHAEVGHSKIEGTHCQGLPVFSKKTPNRNRNSMPDTRTPPAPQLQCWHMRRHGLTGMGVSNADFCTQFSHVDDVEFGGAGGAAPD